MDKNLYKVALLTIIILGISDELQAGLSFRIEVAKDTIFVGEPTVLKCMLKNIGEETIKVYAAPSRPLLTCGKLSFYLTLPDSEHSFRYAVGYSVSASGAPNFTLDPYDSIYWYSVLNWRDWTYVMQERDASNLPVGSYEIRATYFLPAEDSTQQGQFNSNIDSINAIMMPERETFIYSKVGNLMNNFLSFTGSTDENKMIHEVFPEYLDLENSVIAQFCHYLLAFNSRLPRRIELCKSFLSKYPDTPLAEEIELLLARTYVAIGETGLSEKALKEAQQKYPSNVAGYYYQMWEEKIKD